MITLKGVTKKFGQVRAVHEASLTVKEGERVVILGHSGCGKTTLLRLIAGLERPDEGEIIIRDRLASSPSVWVEPIKREIGMIFQDLALWPHMNAMENVGFGLKASGGNKKALDEEIKEILKLVHLENKVTYYPRKLSGGEQQRVALARALAQRPKILLMDEPLVSLDFDLKEQMIKLILDLQRQFDITLVYVTHDRDAANYLNGRVVWMDHGRILLEKP